MKKGVLLPIFSGDGPGVHADYDEANVLAAAVALLMKRACIITGKYSQAFQQLHVWLRGCSAIEWYRYGAVFTPDQVHLFPLGEYNDLPRAGFFVNVGAVYTAIPGNHSVQDNRQLPLAYGLNAVK
ncbi:MAG: hypothetical protein R3F37_02330 [Candidatus Competibacteraceae bacterium]